ncbi:AI-2E family transporter [Bifidobacterium sp.]|jgi:predicted PurR-regulated permease PerM|uniref:AI-2E family transporter n=1 Tax=Bifidobacterium sp. TaxID=41200 RepID=UPI0025BC47F2|nr:AI-2E family transporter [Bifidobacterium sp.]MCH4210073.1 AI-2E family transporter [Bifidobacterium sp.]MCI1225509.1 AI-2E family transporter [Bifidobacterium sp.]
MTPKDDQKIDFASVFPAKGDSRRPPDWWGRALLYAAIAVFLSIFVWQSWGKVEFVVFDIVISLFIALAIEPLVMRLVAHGWRRGAAAGTSLIGLMMVVLALLGLFGNMFVQQVLSMVKGLPGLYDQIAKLVSDNSSFKLPAMESLGNEILKNVQTSWVTDFAGQALTTTVGFFGFLLNALTILMVTFYVSASGPKMRRSLCQWMAPVAQRRFLLGWTVVQDQISGFLFSRTILAVLNAAFTGIFLAVIHVPYWLPLALFCGIVSQFVPTVGTYIGGALPVIFAWSSNGILYAAGVVVFIIIYQQIENLLLSPKVSQRTMDLNPAIAFLSVLVLGAMFGALGAFLALPITASVQAIFKVYTKRYELVDSPLMSDPQPVKKSKVVEGAEAFNEHVIRPMSSRMPRAARGSSARVPMNDEIKRLQGELYRLQGNGDSPDAEDSATVAIPKGALAKKPHGVALRGTEDDENRAAARSAERGDDDGAVAGVANGEADSGDSDMPVSYAPDSSGPDGSEGSDGPDNADVSGASGLEPETDANDNPRSRWH